RRRPGRDQPRAVRSAGGGAGADRRVPHRVQRHAVRALLPRRIREHDCRLLGRDDAVPRRLAAAVSEHAGAPLPVRASELDVVLREVLRVPVSLHLDPRNAPALPLRPADAARMEGADPAGDSESGRHGNRESDAAVSEAIAFYFLSACILGFAVLVISTKDTVHSVLFLVLDFLFVA